MTAAVARSSARSFLPPTQNTAPVIEFSCLFTHDLRRKQKRWHDGVLRYHTFNKRIMVYDTQGGYIGDKHWKREEVPVEGEELSLDKGALVEVGVQVSTTETDISELFKRKSKATPEEASSKSPGPRRPLTAVANTSQPKHKSLSALLGQRQGAYGKALLPNKSPFQKRQEERENHRPGGEHPSKRQKMGNDTSMEANTYRPRPGSLTGHTNLGQQRRAKSPPSKICLDLTSDDIRSDVTLPPTPPLGLDTTRPAVRKPVPVPRGVTSIGETLGENISHRPRPTANTDVSLSPGAGATPVPAAEPGRSSLVPLVASKEPAQSRPLRIAKAPPRRKLMCLGEQPVRTNQTPLRPDGMSQTASAPKARVSFAQSRQKPFSAATHHTGPKQRSLLDIDDELDAMDRGDCPGSPSEATSPSRAGSRAPLQRAMSLNASKPSADAAVNAEPHSKALRRSPFKKIKSMSTTDAGDDTAAKKSRSSKATAAVRDKPVTQPKQPLQSFTVDPWSVEASDLFDWRPPNRDMAKSDVAVDVA